ncbi:MAG: hemolysin family protein [Kineosporiaceae bacterium]
MAAEIALVLAFVLIGGFFAAAEIALVSLRPGQVTRLAEKGRRGRQIERLMEHPNRFLSAVQIGVTLAGFLSAAFGATTLSVPVAAALQDAGMSEGLAKTLALLGVTVLVAYVSLVLGELAPKRIGLQRAEGVAVLAAAPLTFIARAARPVIWLLGVSSDVAVRLFGGDPKASREAVTEEELRDIVATNDELTRDERRLIADVLNAGDRPIREVMVPRLDVSALQAQATVVDALAAVRDLPHSRYPVVDGGLDDVIGFVHVRDLVRVPPEHGQGWVRALARPVLRLPDSRRALPALAEMRRVGSHLAVVVDEYGGGAGIVTLEDLIEELVGDITDEFDVAAPEEDGDAGGSGPRPLPEGSVDAQLRLEEFEEQTGIALPEGPYDTAAGWLMAQLGRIPAEGDSAEVDDVVVVVEQMRGRRVERVRLRRLERTSDAVPAVLVDGSGAAAEPAPDGAGPEGTA